MTSGFKLHHCAAAAVLALASSMSWAQPSGHIMVDPDKLAWVPVASLPKGAMIAVIEGPLNEAVPFTFRIKFPANYRIPPHWHPAVERVTVLSGNFNMGSGETFDAAKSHSLNAGGMTIMPAKSPHFAWTGSETIVQLSGIGPWGITYINPADDPRSK